MFGMKYALLIHDDGPGGAEASRAGAGALREVLERLRADGSFRGARRLAPAAHTTTVRTRDGAPHVSRGPAATTAKPLVGFVIVECDAEARATALASEVGRATNAEVEVRPVAAPGSGGPQRSGVSENSVVARMKEFAFVINVEDSKRPWPGEPAFDDLMDRCGRVLERLDEQSRFRGTERLAPAAEAKHVRITTGGRTSVVDGPFTEARELIGGFILGECESVDEAISLAALLPGAAVGSVEVREAWGIFD